MGEQIDKTYLCTLLSFITSFEVILANLSLCIHHWFSINDSIERTFFGFGVIMGNSKVINGCLYENTDQFRCILCTICYFFDLLKQIIQRLNNFIIHFFDNFIMYMFFISFDLKFDMLLFIEFTTSFKHLTDFFRWYISERTY